MIIRELQSTPTATAIKTAPTTTWNGRLSVGEISSRCLSYDGEKLVAFVRDITEQKKAIKEREELQQQLLQTQKLESIGQLAGGIAHDFNNQLSGILGYAELLSLNLEDKKLNKYAEIIQQGAQNGAKLTQQLLSFARKGQYKKELINLNDIIDETVEILSHTIDKRIQIIWEKSIEGLTIQGDHSRIQNALLNISLNARDAIGKAGRIRIETTMVDFSERKSNQLLDLATGTYICIKVSDNGSGMDESVQKRIFEPFFTTKDIGKGTGMGLPAAYGTVKHHGGDIFVESNLGVGSDFYIYLPFFKAEKKEEERSTPIINGSHSSGILIVDDDETIQSMLSELLTTLGYRVYKAEDGEIGLKYYLANREKINLVILDMIMPNKGGEELYQALKKSNPQLKILISSGYSPEESGRPGLNLPGDRTPRFQSLSA